MSFEIDGPGEYRTRDERVATITGQREYHQEDFWCGNIIGEEDFEEAEGLLFWRKDAGGKRFKSFENPTDIVSKLFPPAGTERERYFAEL